jgi:hypothetical protein
MKKQLGNEPNKYCSSGEFEIAIEQPIKRKEREDLIPYLSSSRLVADG